MPRMMTFCLLLLLSAIRAMPEPSKKDKFESNAGIVPGRFIITMDTIASASVVRKIVSSLDDRTATGAVF